LREWETRRTPHKWLKTRALGGVLKGTLKELDLTPNETIGMLKIRGKLCVKRGFLGGGDGGRRGRKKGGRARCDGKVTV